MKTKKMKARYRLHEDQETIFKRGSEGETWVEKMRLEMRKKYDKEDEKIPVRESVEVKYLGAAA